MSNPTTTAVPELLPCPFCGSGMIRIDPQPNGWMSVRCVCGATKRQVTEFREQMVAEWNQRVPTQPAPDGWQPIESAPKNESVLVYIPNAEHYGDGVYRAMLVGDSYLPYRWSTFGLHVGRACGADYQPTHWKPLGPLPGAAPTQPTPVSDADAPPMAFVLSALNSINDAAGVLRELQTRITAPTTETADANEAAAILTEIGDSLRKLDVFQCNEAEHGLDCKCFWERIERWLASPTSSVSIETALARLRERYARIEIPCSEDSPDLRQWVVRVGKIDHKGDTLDAALQAAMEGVFQG